ncbi:lipopolysaccharide export system permease protein [Loktanella sp. DSM 29012]|uniref:LPS export ABC transporter permease LptF n=1 Tax=Loktanella sp. DSM 29012 TaxID=1881056 RepID=UPI0008C7558E|nr:LPS export ABC transporter permease LptF [Loktanella sp. DSM 29012]SEQ24880.1 lipopolysaccharide export system permease protein [Loktanella sp. DSM 29012]
MGRIDRYLLRQLVLVFNFFGLVLVMVYWINAAVRLFDQLIADGQSASVIGQLLVLTLPNVIRAVVPIAAFAAAIYVTNRLSQDSELVVIQATGFSGRRLARPFIYFGLMVFVGMSLLVHVLTPLSAAVLNDRQAEIARSVTARILTEGQFIEPATGITIYIRDIAPNGELRDVMLSDMRDADTSVTYTASRAYLVNTGDTTQLVMVDGMAQTLRADTQRLFVTEFADFSYGIGDLITTGDPGPRNLRQITSQELWTDTAAVAAETDTTQARVMAEFHDRNSQALFGIVGALLGFATLMLGSFSRFGVWPQIILAVVLLVVVKALETIGLDAAQTSAAHWPLAYLAVGVGLLIVAVLLFIAGRPYLFHRKPGQVT